MGVPRIFGLNFSGFLAWWLADRLLGLPKSEESEASIRDFDSADSSVKSLSV
jgi:hypothetical protein